MINPENDPAVGESAAQMNEASDDEKMPEMPAAVTEQIAEQNAGRERQFSEDFRILEALLFATAEPVTERMIAERLNEGADVPALLEELK